jgi:hypothetical protein
MPTTLSPSVLASLIETLNNNNSDNNNNNIISLESMDAASLESMLNTFILLNHYNNINNNRNVLVNSTNHLVKMFSKIVKVIFRN